MTILYSCGRTPCFASCNEIASLTLAMTDSVETDSTLILYEKLKADLTEQLKQSQMDVVGIQYNLRMLDWLIEERKRLLRQNSQ